MTQPQPTQEEVNEELKSAVRDGRQAFSDPRWKRAASGEDRPSIAGSLVSELVTGPLTKSGVQITGVIIAGDINLRNAHGTNGGACNALKLEDCDLVGNDPSDRPALDARHSHLSRLSLINCRTTGIHLSSAIIDGDLILDGIGGDMRLSAYPTIGASMPRECWIRARGVRIGGSLTATGARFKLQRALPYWHARETISAAESAALPHNAVDFENAQITGSMSLRLAFVVGALNVQGATIGGDLRISGAYLRPSPLEKDDDVLRANSVHIGGRLFVDSELDTRKEFDPEGPVETPFTTRGTLNFTDATVIGSVQIMNAKRLRSRRSVGFLLYAENAHFGSTLRIVDFDGAIGLSGSDVAHDLTIRADSIELVEARRLRVGGKLTLAGTIRGLVDLSGCVIDGDMAIGDERWIALATESGSQPELRLTGTSVGRNLRVSPITTNIAGAGDWVNATLLRMRTTDLRCYPGWHLGNALLRPGTGSDVAVVAFLYQPTDVSPEHVVVLDGESATLHEHNRVSRALDVGSRQNVMAYLSLFCDHLWPSTSAFTLIPGTIRVDDRKSRLGWRAYAQVSHNYDRAQATFCVSDDGDVTMLDDYPIGSLSEDQPIRIASPARWMRVAPSTITESTWPSVPTVDPGDVSITTGTSEPTWRDVSKKEREAIWAAVKAHPGLHSRQSPEHIEPRASTASAVPKIDLAGLKVGSLSDEDGRNWAELSERSPGRWQSIIRLNLDGFTYDRIDERAASRASRERQLASRQAWLSSQYDADLPTKDEYSPQPYQQLARMFRATGDYGAADDITFDKLRTERLVLDGRIVDGGLRVLVWVALFVFGSLAGLIAFGAITHDVAVSVVVAGLASSVLLLLPTRVLKRWLFELPFGYGLRTWRAATTFAIFLLVGLFAVQVAPLVVDASAVSTVVSTGQGNQLVTLVPITAVTTDKARDEVPCDERDPLLYALDVMVPVIDLRQEVRCKMSSKASQMGALWRLGKGAYALGGWIVVSGLILTVSGVVRRQVEK